MSATTTPAATLAGGIRATIANANRHGATLSLCDGGRVLSLTLTPAQVAEMAVWPANGDVDPDNLGRTASVYYHYDWFAELGAERRYRTLADEHADIAALAALARAALPLVCPAGEGEDHER